MTNDPNDAYHFFYQYKHILTQLPPACQVRMTCMNSARSALVVGQRLYSVHVYAPTVTITFQKIENNGLRASGRAGSAWREAILSEGGWHGFPSAMIFQWQYQGVLARSEGRFGTMWTRFRLAGASLCVSRCIARRTAIHFHAFGLGAGLLRGAVV